MKILAKIEKYICQLNLLSKNKPIIVGVSGGADSIALLHILYELGYNCIAAHCNFHLRGSESDEDEIFVTKVAQKLSLPLFKVDFDTEQYATVNKISIEMAARDLRYNWFESLLKETDSQAIAVAHHANDNVETLLMNLVRGTGISGLTGIPVKNNHIVRLMLCVTREEIEGYLKDNNLSYCTDSTNKSSDYTRNKFRNKIIPLLQEINPSVQETLFNFIGYFKGVEKIYRESVSQKMERITTYESDKITIDLNQLLNYDYAENILYEMLYPLQFTPATIKIIFENLQAESGRIFYSSTHKALLNRDELVIVGKHSSNPKVYYISDLNSKDYLPINLNFTVHHNISVFLKTTDKTKIYVDLSKITFPLELRRWKNGDIFQPFGMKGKKKISDFFVDLKLSRIEKEECWILLSQNKVLWIVGYRMDYRFKVSEHTKEILEISI